METRIMAFPFFRSNRSKRPVRRRPSFVPRLESLEDRTVLSTLTVLNNLDSGAGALRDAIGHAKDGDTIIFAPALTGLTITHGRARGGQTTAGGGGILNAGSTLNLANDLFSYNVDFGSSSGAQGGAIGNFHKDGILTVTDSTFIGNRADGTGSQGSFA